MIPSIGRGIFYMVLDDLEGGLLDNAIRRLPNERITEEIINDPELRAAAVEGIKCHLIEDTEYGDLDAALRIKETFRIPNGEIEEAAKQGIERWVMERGPEFGEKICAAFNIPKEFMESEGVKVGKEVFLHRYGRTDGSRN